MAPSSATSKSVTIGSTRLRGTASASREATPTASKPSPAKMPRTRSDTELAGLLKVDLVAIRDLATCSICDQLLYEPWTLACGHTYCYSCLCNWFVPNKRKKTCPECRAKVKVMPGPNFLVKQMVEVLMKRKEIMPDDESAEQHYQRKSEEIREVEKDKTGPEGLFKGCFPTLKSPWRDEAEGVMRCPECGHEHVGGPACENCGIELDMDDFFSDMDDDFDADDLGLESGLEEIEAELDNEFAAHREHLHRNPYLDAGIPHPRPYHAFVQHYHQHHRYPTTEPSDGSDMDSDEENEGSLHEFVVPDDEEPVRGPGPVPNNGPVEVVTISDDDDSEDEGGAVSNRRPQRRGRPAVQFSDSPPSVITVTTNESERGDEADMLRHAGWSPLDQGNDSDAEDHVPFGYGVYHSGNGVTDGEESDTNTETMAGNQYTDDEDDYEHREHSLTPGPGFHYNQALSPGYQNYPRRNSAIPPEYYDADSELEELAEPSDLEQVTDRDGDTEMTPEFQFSSMSPMTSRGASLASTINPNTSYTRNPYSESRSSRGVSLSTNNDHGGVSESSMAGRRERVDSGPSVADGRYVDLGVANQMNGVEPGDSSDSSIRGPPRRQPRRYHSNPRGQQYDPRISMIFAAHQQSLRGTQSNPIGLDEWDEMGNEVRRVEPASRHRRMTAYRDLPPRRNDPLRSSRSPSVGRVISVADRSSRIPRQYRRN
ncbi:hypothetical protein V8E51_000934 [Hyaloscypha variabilis]